MSQFNELAKLVKKGLNGTKKRIFTGSGVDSSSWTPFPNVPAGAKVLFVGNIQLNGNGSTEINLTSHTDNGTVLYVTPETIRQIPVVFSYAQCNFPMVFFGYAVLTYPPFVPPPIAQG